MHRHHDMTDRTRRFISGSLAPLRFGAASSSHHYFCTVATRHHRLTPLPPQRYDVISTNDTTNLTLRLMSDASRYGRRAFKALMRSYHFNIPKYDLPLRIRPVSNAPFILHTYN